MLKIYEVNGFTFQYEEGEQPEGAIEVGKAKPKAKAKKPANKARSTKSKEQ